MEQDTVANSPYGPAGTAKRKLPLSLANCYSLQRYETVTRQPS